MKTCVRCAMRLPAYAFGNSSKTIDGLQTACRICESIRAIYYKHGLAGVLKEQLIELQDGCALCGRDEPGKKGWVIDHDRACCPGDKSCDECRRGVLCSWCNTAMGYAGDNPTVLRRMADYLELETRLPPSGSLVGLADGTPTEITEKTDRT